MSNPDNILKLVNNKEWDKIIKKLKDIDQPIWNEFRLIHYAVIQNDIKLFDKLIKKNAKLNLINVNSETVAHIAATNGYIELFKKIIKLEPKLIYNKNNVEDTVLHIIADNAELLKIIFNQKSINWSYILKQKNKKGLTPLNLSIAFGDYNSVRIFFDHPDVNLEEPMDNIPIISLIKYDHFTNQDKIKLLELYVKKNGDINVINSNGNNLLLTATYLNNFTLFRKIVELGGDVDYMSPISTVHVLRENYIVSLQNDNLKMINFALKQKNLNFNKRDKYLDTFGHYILLHRIYNNQGDFKIEKKVLRKMNDFNTPNVDGNTILHLICMIGWKKYKKILEGKVLDIFIKNLDNISVLDFVSEDEKDNFMSFIAINNLKIEKKTIDKSNIDKTIKKIYKKEDSIPESKKEKIDVDLVSKQGFAYYSTYEATMREVLIYSIYLLNKYKKYLTIPIKDSYVQDLFSLDLKKTSDIYLQTADIYHQEILDYIVFWEDKDNYFISDNLFNLIEKIIKEDKRNIFLYLSIGSPETMLHANVIYIDIKNKRIERFDPYGNIEKDYFDSIDNVLSKEFSKINDFKYIGTSYMGITSFQTISRETDIHKKKFGDLGGFCLAWCIWFIELRLKNADIDSKILVEKTIKKMVKNKIEFIEFVRNYAASLDRYLRKFIQKAGVKKKNLYNQLHTNNDYNKIKNKIYSEFKKF
jgi:ankyrin repeat protein